ncbi:MAG: 50S ribosomal protein L9 [Candidatus Pacebacteria bacterium]|jgi:large subunit ribosomal protein L9|nr:50S ribosomal protein L9 [Candidatus Paceibacterota bacterium]
MKVILLQDVAKIGKRFSVVNVPDGYAINQLIPKKLALPATPENLKRTLRHNQAIAANKEADSVRFDAAVAALTDKAVIVTADANEQGHLFKAVHETEIAAAATVAGLVIDAQMVKITTPIKSLGEHEVWLIGGKKEQPFTVTVVKK